MVEFENGKAWDVPLLGDIFCNLGILWTLMNNTISDAIIVYETTDVFVG